MKGPRSESSTERKGQGASWPESESARVLLADSLRGVNWPGSEKAQYPCEGYQSTRHTVISSHGHVVTRSTRHRSTRHTHVSSNSQLVTSEHIAKRILECGPMPNVMVALPNTGGALCSTPQSLADALY